MSKTLLIRNYIWGITKLQFDMFCGYRHANSQNTRQFHCNEQLRARKFYMYPNVIFKLIPDNIFGHKVLGNKIKSKKGTDFRFMIIFSYRFVYGSKFSQCLHLWWISWYHHKHFTLSDLYCNYKIFFFIIETIYQETTNNTCNNKHLYCKLSNLLCIDDKLSSENWYIKCGSGLIFVLLQMYFL